MGCDARSLRLRVAECIERSRGCEHEQRVQGDLEMPQTLGGQARGRGFESRHSRHFHVHRGTGARRALAAIAANQRSLPMASGGREFAHRSAVSVALVTMATTARVASRVTGFL